MPVKQSGRLDSMCTKASTCIFLSQSYCFVSIRINVAGNHVISFMQRLLQLKHPAHQQAVTLSRAQELVHDHAYMATDFMTELNEWKDGLIPEGKLRKIQLPFTPVSSRFSV